jgi:hypothetical protein
VATGVTITNTNWRAGDILAFSGRSAVSWAIRIGTLSRFSHVGIVSWTPREQLLSHDHRSKWISHAMTFVDQPLLYESTTLNTIPCRITGKPIDGVQAQDPEQRVATYDGEVYLLRLTAERQLNDRQQWLLTNFLLYQIGLPYDRRGALLSATSCLKRLLWKSPYRHGSWFCDALTAQALQTVDRLPPGNATFYTPASLIRALLMENIYAEPERLK